jgi:hypothetical protein
MTPQEMENRVKTRVQKMDTSMLLEWASLAASGMQRQIDDFRRSPDEAHLAEVNVALISMGAVVDELAVRLKQQQDSCASGS